LEVRKTAYQLVLVLFPVYHNGRDSFPCYGNACSVIHWFFSARAFVLTSGNMLYPTQTWAVDAFYSDIWFKLI